MINKPNPKKRILITGAEGRIGQVLAAAWADQYELCLVDVRPPAHLSVGANFVLADVTNIEQMRQLCAQADVVIHLAISGGDMNDDWEQVAPVNLQGTWAVFQAAYETNVQRVIFASSVQVDFNPQNPYGASKRWGEILAKQYTDRTPLSILCLRLGAVAKQGDTRIAIGKPFLGYILTHADLVRLFTASVEAPQEIRYGIFYGISANQRPTFNIADAKKILGYNPQDDAYKLARRALLTPKGTYRLGIRIAKKAWEITKKYGINFSNHPCL